MSQNVFRYRIILVGGLIAVALLIVAQVWAHSSGPPPAQAVPVQDQPAKAPLHLEVAFAGNALIGTVTVSDKDGRPWMDVRGQAYLLDSSGRPLAVIPLQPLGPGEFRLIAPLDRLDAPGYLDVRLPGRGRVGEQRSVYQIDRDRRAVTWVKAAPDTGAPLTPQATGGPDEFGYTWDDAATYAWIDTSGGTSITLRDDDWMGPCSIGFTFNFYGQNYTQFYLDSNGYIGFDNTQTESYYLNTRLPSARRPNNLIASFWDDFDPSQDGTVRYQTFGTSPNRYLVVEWSGVPLWGTSDAQSFQVILYETSNNIKFQYPTARSGDGGDLRYAITGIENEDGTIGLEYLYLIPTDETRAVQFNYNRSAYNVFLTPERQGSLAAAGEAASFRLTIKNLGSSSDSFVLSRPTYTGSNWSVSFYEANGTTPLSGNNTGTIAAGSEKEIVVKLQVPSSATVGDWTRATVRATSQGNPGEYHEVTLDAMFGTSFAQVYTDNESGDSTEDSENYFDPLQEGHRYTRRVTTDQDNSFYAGVATTPDGDSVNVWNTTYYNGTARVSEIQYAVLNRYGDFVRPVTRLTDNSAATQPTYDFSPAVDVAPNGNIAIGWAQQVDTTGDGIFDRRNAWYAVVSSSGTVVKPPTALTTNPGGGYPRDYPPSVAALTGGRFLLTWEHADSSGESVYLDIHYAVLDSNGTVVTTNSLTDGTVWNMAPRVAPLRNGGAAIVWTTYNADLYPEIAYATVDSTGTVTGGPMQITSNGDSGALSGYADAIALSDGRLAVAWTQQSGDDQQIQYAIFSGSPTPTPTSTPEATPTNTPTPTSTPDLLFFDDFSDPNSGWSQYSTEGGDAFYENGEYHILVREQDRIYTGVRAQVFSDFDVRVKARALEPSSSAVGTELQSRSDMLFDPKSRNVSQSTLRPDIDCAYGLIFRHVDSDNNYHFAVSPSAGQYYLFKWVNGVWVTIQPWTSSPHINPGTVVNELRVMAEGPDISLYVNDHHLIDVTDTSFSEGWFGLAAWTWNFDAPTHAAFDDFAVYGTGAPTPTPTATLTPTSTPTPTQPPSGGIHGQVTYQGSPIAGIHLVLRFYDGSSWSTALTTVTQADETYQFTGASSLTSGQRYYVRYNNGSDGNPNNPDYLWPYCSFDITSYTAGASIEGGDFDIANIPLVSPSHGATVSLPCTFEWTRRTATPSDDYLFDLFDPVDYDPWWWTDPTLGYVGNYTLNSLPPGFSTGTQYGWGIWVYGPDGGYGVSYYYHTITFSSGVASLQGEVGEERPLNRLALDRLVEARKARTPSSASTAVDLQRNEPTPSKPTFRPTDAAQTIHTVPNDLSDANINVSLTTDQDDNLIMTWLDNYGERYLFYALADSSGNILTPATIFQRTRHSRLWSSWNGYGNDVLTPAGPPPPHIVYLPVVVRNYPPPPPPPVVKNGGFEEGNERWWTFGGDASGLRPRVVTSQRHSGSYATVLGQEGAPCRAEEGGLVGQSWIYQYITVPASGSPQLTFYYRIFTYDKLVADKYDRFEVYINGTLLDRFGNTGLGWGPAWRCDQPVDDLDWQPSPSYDLSAYRGQTVRLRLVNITHPDDCFGTWTYVDDVAVTQ